jgi:hypothetical protein
MRFVSQMTLPAASPRFPQPEAGRPRVSLVPSLSREALRRAEKVRLRSESLWLPGGMIISTISRRRLVHKAG